MPALKAAMAKHIFFFTCHGKTIKYQKPPQIFVMGVEILIPTKWKLKNTWCFRLGEKQFSCEKYKNSYFGKAIHQDSFDHVKVSPKPFLGIQTGWVKLKFYLQG